MNICVIGMGKIGLPLAIQFANCGGDVIGLDINSQTIDLINKGVVPFPGEPRLDISLKDALDRNKFIATSSYQIGIHQAEVIVVLVPVILDKNNNPNFENIDSATKEFSKYLKDGVLISFETTLPIGTTRNRLTKMIEKESGKKVGIDFFVVFSPERVSSGRIFEDLRKYPKLVGGITPECTARGIDFYKSFLEFDERHDLARSNGPWPMASVESSEFSKLAETTYRDVNIALANRFMIHAEELNLDISEIIEAANSQPYSHIHTPGISVGGHCIPVYPYLYLFSDRNAKIVETARLQNEEMPEYFVNKIKQKEKKMSKISVLVLGIAYRPNVKESAYSGVFDLVQKIEAEDANAFVLDPLYDKEEILKLGLKPFEDFDNIDYIILHTAHQEFKKLKINEFKKLKGIVDGRNFFVESEYSSFLIR
jgi:nucleotide sugar dehydrogenase